MENKRTDASPKVNEAATSQTQEAPLPPAVSVPEEDSQTQIDYISEDSIPPIDVPAEETYVMEEGEPDDEETLTPEEVQVLREEQKSQSRRSKEYWDRLRRARRAAPKERVADIQQRHEKRTQARVKLHKAIERMRKAQLHQAVEVTRDKALEAQTRKEIEEAEAAMRADADSQVA